MSPLKSILAKYRQSAKTEREKGTYFEELIQTYFRYEATYADLYSDVWLYADWAKDQGLDARDTGIDLVAKTSGTAEFHAIQCKFYAEDYTILKKDIDSFFTASGQKPFTHRIIVCSTNRWSDNAENALIGQQPAVTKIDLHDLENSQIQWESYQPSKPPALKAKFGLRPHQSAALQNVTKKFAATDRGKLIMACGTGKTFTSLKIAEAMGGPGKRVLFLVPSLSLLSQTLTEWTQQSVTPLHSFAVCSDDEVGKKRNKDEDVVETFAHELRYPATTDAKRLAVEMAKRHDQHHMSVVFSTYHSIDVISRAQHLHGLGAFALIICDEAHRTTGATFEDERESNFVKVHDPEFIRAAKRLYMTATPRIYADMAKALAERDQVTLCSMDDPALFGEQLHVINFSEAVTLGLLTDYKVIVLTIDEAHVSARLQDLLKDENNELKVDDAARIVGCWKALSKQGLTGDLQDGTEPMRRAVAFCQVIEPKKGRVHKVSSKQISSMFQTVVDAYQAQDAVENALVCEAEHVDGTMNATEKESKLNWLKSKAPENTCRILSNVRCLSEGVDVPALDAVLFLTPRSSQVDVVQSVGRVMRTAPGKKRGYVVLPVVIPAGMQAHEALNDNKVYKVVWEVLQALRSHDDRFDAMINKLDLIGKDNKKMEVIAITDKVAKQSKRGTGKKSGKGGSDIGTQSDPVPVQAELQFNVGELERALYARVVKKCGNRNYWDEWAKDIAKIAQTHITRITTIVENPVNARESAAFTAFAAELRDDLNDSITDGEVIEMLAQHLITKPVFDALFENYSFASHNPVSLAMQQVLDVLHEHHLEKEADTLDKFYASVKMRAAGIDSATGKQKIVVELYDKFFRNAFPKMTERLGIVYTPVEVVDFIIHSINDLLQSEFGQSLGSPGVHIIDPFTGTGTFITRLLQSGLISKEQLAHKYKNEIHANEIVLLAYYIAAINIEAVYHGIMGYGARGIGDMGYGVQGIGDGVEDMGYGVQGVGYGAENNQLKNKENHDENSIIQRSDCLAGSDESCGNGLSADKEISSGGAVRFNGPGEAVGGVDSGQHSGGIRTAAQERVSPLSVNCQRVTDRTGNTHANCATCKVSGCTDDADPASSDKLNQQTTHSLAQGIESGWGVDGMGYGVRGIGDGAEKIGYRVRGIGYGVEEKGNGVQDTEEQVSLSKPHTQYPKPHFSPNPIFPQTPSSHTPNPIPHTPSFPHTPYTPFAGICLTDTFQLYEKDDLVSTLLMDNSDRRKRQKDLDIRVIMGNPPYSAGQESANDNNQNVAYPDLDQSIRATYAAHSKMTSVKNLYDSYIRAIRWASDRVGKSGIIGYVTNAGFLEANTADGLRKCLAEEFSSIYVFHLRGNARTSGEVRRKEKDNVFGQGTRTPIAISILVKNPDAKQHGQIFWHDIGDYLKQEEKLAIISNFASLNGISKSNGWTTIKPDAHYDWINQRDNSFERFIKIGDKRDKTGIFVFENYSLGLGTNRDAWCYNSSKSTLCEQMKSTINFYNAEVDRYVAEKPTNLGDFVMNDTTKIAWSSSLLPKVEKHIRGEFSETKITQAVYRPFQKQWVYFDNMFNHRVGQMPKIYPNSNLDNLTISMTGRGSTKEFCVFISNTLPDLEMVSKGQCFPLYLYEKENESHSDPDDLFATTSASKAESGYTRKDGISDAGLAHFKAAYPGEAITKEDLFYYIYGLLHSPEYRTRYADNLSKELPRIPCVKQAADFWSYSQAGRDLADLHLNYETVECYPARLDYGKNRITTLQDADYRVVKMKFPRVRDAEGKSVADKTTVIYNPHITIRDIPLAAYDYIVNGKPALEWVMERQGVTTDKASGIVNDANLWAIETMHNAKYPLELLLRVITVSLETMKIVNSLPELDID